MSETFEEHLCHLEAIFKKFSEHNITINSIKKEKSRFLRSKATFLGHIISPEGITMDSEKIKTIQHFQAPQNKQQIQSFLGFINFYRKYIRDLSQSTAVLSQLVKKRSHVDMGNNTTESL